MVEGPETCLNHRSWSSTSERKKAPLRRADEGPAGWGATEGSLHGTDGFYTRRRHGASGRDHVARGIIPGSNWGDGTQSSGFA